MSTIALPSMIPAYIHELSCRSWEYRDNDYCDCTPEVAVERVVQWIDPTNNVQQERTFNTRQYLNVVDRVSRSGGTIRKVDRITKVG